MKRTRVARLEQYARSRPCPGCGKAFDPLALAAGEFDWGRLTAAEQAELAGLVAAVATPPCGRCGRSRHDLTGQTDGQLDRTLALLRTLLGREMPGGLLSC